MSEVKAPLRPKRRMLSTMSRKEIGIGIFDGWSLGWLMDWTGVLLFLSGV